MTLRVVNEIGKGRPCVCIRSASAHETLCAAMVSELCLSERVLQIEVSSDLHSTWRESLDDLRALLAEHKVRNASYVGFGAGSALAIQQAIEHSKDVRRLAVIDGTTRPSPTMYEKCLDYIEASLPLGLPFRKKSDLFDAKPYLQRVRCPVLIGTTSQSSAYQKAEAARMLARCPSAWFVDLTADSSDEAARSAIRVFLALDPKCPQKAIRKNKQAVRL